MTGIAEATLNAWLDALCRSTTYTEPAAFYVKLHLGDPGAAGTANPAVETTREQATFAAASGAATTTTADLTWTTVAATETYSYVSFWDDPTAGTFLGAKALTTPRPVTAGDTFTIPSSDGSVTLTPFS